MSNTHEPASISMSAADGCEIRGLFWKAAGLTFVSPRESHRRNGTDRGTVVVAPATAVSCRYYVGFAEYLFHNGYDVVTFDYRGIAGSRPSKMRHFRASWLDWGHFDLEAALQYARTHTPGQKLYLVGHSIGGFLAGLAPSSGRLARVVTVGAQYAYWRDYAAGRRLAMVLKWHALMPLITLAFGYFPGKRIGWVEDMPAGVVRDWVFSRSRFEARWSRAQLIRHGYSGDLPSQFANLAAPILALSVQDDEFGTVEAINRSLAYYPRSVRTHLHIMPQEVGQESIGHFGFFNRRFRESLWPIALNWLREGDLGACTPGTVLSVTPAVQ